MGFLSFLNLVIHNISLHKIKNGEHFPRVNSNVTVMFVGIRAEIRCAIN